LIDVLNVIMRRDCDHGCRYWATQTPGNAPRRALSRDWKSPTG